MSSLELSCGLPPGPDFADLAFEADRDAVGLEGCQHHGKIPRPLVHHLAALLAFLLELLEMGRRVVGIDAGSAQRVSQGLGVTVAVIELSASRSVSQPAAPKIPSISARPPLATSPW